MSHPTVIYWPDFLTSAQEIAPAQIVADDGNNNFIVRIRSNAGNMPNVPVNNSGIYYMPHMIRKLSFGATADLSGLNIIIRGLSCPVDGITGNPTQVLTVADEVVTGPTAGVAGRTATTRIYARVDSIILSGNTGANQIYVGLGRSGITNYVYMNLNNSAPQHWTLQGNPTNNNAGFLYSFYMSLTRPETINYNQGNLIPFPQSIPAFLIGAAQTGGNYLVSNFDNKVIGKNGVDTTVCSPIANIIWANINDTTAPGEVQPNTGFYFTCIQQGIAQ